MDGMDKENGLAVAHGYFEKHKDKLETAKSRLIDLNCWSGFAEIPSEKIYGEGAKDAGWKAFESHRGTSFPLDGHAGKNQVAGEVSPYGISLDITYPSASVAELLQRAADPSVLPWSEATAEDRSGVLLEALERLSARSFEMAHAVMHTTGQAFMMAFQAGAAHALDRGLESVAAAVEQQNRWPSRVRWEKPQGKHPPIVVDKSYRMMPRGIGVVIGCNTFPTWNGYPGLFASLACGNPVIVKPHPRCRLPLAIAVQVIRQTLADAGFGKDIAQFAADTIEEPIAKELATADGIALVDYTGSAEFGNWLEQNCSAQVFAEKSGRNSVLVSDFADMQGMARNLAMSLSLYSGQMCTSPQDIYIVSDNKNRFDEVSSMLAKAMEGLLGDDKRAVEILGAIANPSLLDELASATEDCEVLLASRKIDHPEFKDARIHTPALVLAGDGDKHKRELFGPMAALYKVDGFNEGLSKISNNAKKQGALTAAIYADDTTQVERFESECARAGVNTAANLTGAALVNHSAAFSDFHGTGANPAANASLTDVSFITPRFFVQESKREGN